MTLADENRPPSGEGEEELVEGCKSGNLAAFERLYELNAPRMKSIAFNLLGNTADAEDAVQESFLKIYRAAPAFRGQAAFSSWTYRVLVNSCYDILRKGRRRPETVEVLEDLPQAAAADHPLRMSLQKCLGRLSSRYRAVFLLFEVEGFSHREIGEILEIPEGTSKTLLFNAKRELQSMLWGERRSSVSA